MIEWNEMSDRMRADTNFVLSLALAKSDFDCPVILEFFQLC